MYIDGRADMKIMPNIRAYTLSKRLNISYDEIRAYYNNEYTYLENMPMTATKIYNFNQFLIDIHLPPVPNCFRMMQDCAYRTEKQYTNTNNIPFAHVARICDRLLEQSGNVGSHTSMGGGVRQSTQISRHSQKAGSRTPMLQTRKSRSS